MWMIGAETLLASAAVAWLVTPSVARLAYVLGALDHPGPRKVHAIAVPRVGGLALLAGFTAGLAVAAATSGYVRNEHWPRATYWAAVGAAALGMLVLGLVDDIRGLRFTTKFTVQILAACLVWETGFRIEVLGFPAAHGIDVGVWSLPLTVLWIVGVTNAINLIDGLDGLAAGTALISTSAIAIVAVYRGSVAVSAVSVALAGSLLGFLRYNFNPARIFLGDSGSMFLGFVLAVISIHGSQKNVAAVAVLAPFLLLGYPLLDTGLAVARRLIHVRNDSRANGGVGYLFRNLYRVFLPDRGHLHHRLLEVGLTHRGAVLSLYACTMALAAGALVLVIMNSFYVACALAAALCLLSLAFALLVVVRARLARRDGPATSPPAPRTSEAVASGGALGPR